MPSGGMGIVLPEFTSSSPALARGLNNMAREVERQSQMPIAAGMNVLSNGNGVFTVPLPQDQPILTLNNTSDPWVKGSKVTVNVYLLAGGASVGEESDSGIQLQNVYVRLGDIAPGKWAYVAYVNNYLEIWNAEC